MRPPGFSSSPDPHWGAPICHGDTPVGSPVRTRSSRPNPTEPYGMPQASRLTPHASCLMPHASCLTPHASRLTPGPHRSTWWPPPPSPGRGAGNTPQPPGRAAPQRLPRSRVPRTMRRRSAAARRRAPPAQRSCPGAGARRTWTGVGAQGRWGHWGLRARDL